MRTYLDVTASSVEVEVQVLNLAVLAELVLDGLLVGLLVDVGDHYDPALDGADGGGAAVGLHLGLVAGGRAACCLGGGGGGGVVDFHFYVGHFRGCVLGGAGLSWVSVERRLARRGRRCLGDVVER